MTLPPGWINRSLLRTPIPEEGESLNGFLLRVAEENGFEQSAWVLNAAGANLTIATSPCDLSALSQLLRLDTADLRRMAYWPMPPRPRAYLSFFDVELRNYHIQSDPCRVCPECLVEQGFCRAVWDARLACVCPSHGKQLLETCSSCSEPISWRRTSLFNCEGCGGDFRHMNAKRASSNAIAVSQAIYHALRVPSGTLGEGFPGFVTEIPPIQLLDLVKFLGSYSLEPEGALERIRLPRRNPEQLHLLLDAAGEILTRWPEGFHDLLHEVRERNVGVITRTGLSGQFGDFYITLMHRYSTGPLAAVKEAFLAFVNMDGGTAYPTKRGYKFDFSGERDFMTRPEVAEFLGIAAQTVDVLHRDGEIEGNLHPWGMTKTHGVYSKASVEAYRERRLHIIESNAAAARLGLSSVTFRQLVDYGVLEPYSREKYSFRKAYEIDERNIDDLLQKLDALVTSLPEKDGTTYHMTTVRLGSVGLTGADLLKKVLDGSIRISIARDTAAGLRRYLFSTRDIDTLISAYLAKLPARPVVANVGSSLGIEPRFVCRLLSSGVLRSRTGKDGKQTVPTSEIKRFQSRYVSVREIAGREGKPAQHVLDLFCGAGHSPLLGKSLGATNSFLDRHQADQVFGGLNHAA